MIMKPNYKYYMPTRIIMGNDCIIGHKDIFKALGQKALIVTGAQSAKKNGSAQDIITALESVDISYVIYDKVMANPTVSCVYEGAEFAKENMVDFVIAAGGGSPMDAAKAIALLAAQDIAEEDLFSGIYEDKVLPMAFVPTTAGTGSEVTPYSILTNVRAETKTSIASDLLFPTIAFLDARYTVDLPLTITINTTLDALSHGIESMLTVRASAISNSLAAESIRMIMCCMPDIVQALEAGAKTRLNPDKRELLLQASCLAGMAISQTATTLVHSMGYSLTYFMDVDHGRANGLLIGEYLRLVKKSHPDLVERILKVMELPSIDSFQDMMNSLLGKKEKVSPEDINRYSKITMRARNLPNSILVPTEDEVHEMFERSVSK